MSQPVSMAEKKRHFVRRQLWGATVALLRERDFDAIGADDIAVTAGVSRRTVFRYCTSKEDLVLAYLDRYDVEGPAALAARPPDEPPADALRCSLPGGAPDEHEPDVVELARLTLTVPALHAHYLHRQAQWHSDLSVVLAQRLTADLDDPGPLLAVGLAFVAFDAALRAWVDGGGRRHLDAHVEDLFATAGPAINDLVRPRHPRSTRG